MRANILSNGKFILRYTMVFFVIHLVLGVVSSQSVVAQGTTKKGLAPIVDIKIRAMPSMAQSLARKPLPEWGDGYELLDVDLNKGMGGKTDFIYLFYKRSWNGKPITGLYIIDSKNDKPRDGFTKIDVDLNKGAGADYLYLCYTKNPDLKPVKSLLVLHQDKSPVGTDIAFTRIDVNLNKGGGRRGDNIFLWYGK
ncbi:MAG: hypothetical protein ACRC2T_02690 [Thermoguttaceae bacterium]